MQLITNPIKGKLLRNGYITNRGDDHIPVVKFFGGSGCTWLITEMDSADYDTLFGLCDLGMGYPELGYTSLQELESMKFPPFGLGVERDLHFKADKTLSQYHNEAIEAHRIIA
jgi:hypothetical protein